LESVVSDGLSWNLPDPLHDYRPVLAATRLLLNYGRKVLEEDNPHLSALITDHTKSTVLRFGNKISAKIAA